MATREEVSEFLSSFKLAIDYGRCQFRGRLRTEQDLIDLNLTRNQALDVICSLEPRDYSSGPHPDDTDSAKEVWVFGHDLDGVEVYIKLRLVEIGGAQFPRGLVWSFHPAEHPMKHPLRGGA